MSEEILPAEIFHGWHWLSHDRKLRYEDGRTVEDNVPLSSDKPPELCRSGMHASATIRDALNYAGLVSWSDDGYAWLCRVTLTDNVIKSDDKCVARTRTVLESRRVHISSLVGFAQRCAAYSAAYSTYAAYAAYAAWSAESAASAARSAAWSAESAESAERAEQEKWLQEIWDGAK